jgi:hypothetical protein
VPGVHEIAAAIDGRRAAVVRRMMAAGM